VPHLFRRETVPTSLLSPIETDAPAFRRDGRDGAGGVPRERQGQRLRELILKRQGDCAARKLRYGVFRHSHDV